MKKMILCAICAICGFTTANAQKFGHVNAQEIMQAMPETTKAQAELEALAKQYDEDLKSLQAEIQKKAEEVEKLPAETPANIKERRQKEVEDMFQKYQQSASENQQALNKAQQEKLQPIQKKLFDAITAVGQEGGYVYIMQIGTALYTSTTLSTDVTAQVKAKLGLK